MGNKIAVTLQVDDEVKGLCDALVKECQDIKAKAGLAQQGSDALQGLIPILGGLKDLPNDVKQNKDDRKYILGALDEMAEVFLNPAPAPAAQA